MNLDAAESEFRKPNDWSFYTYIHTYIYSIITETVQTSQMRTLTSREFERVERTILLFQLQHPPNHHTRCTISQSQNQSRAGTLTSEVQLLSGW